MGNDEILINLKGLTVGARKSIIKTLKESQELVNDSVNELALIQMVQFDNEETPDYLSEMEEM